MNRKNDSIPLSSYSLNLLAFPMMSTFVVHCQFYFDSLRIELQPQIWLDVDFSVVTRESQEKIRKIKCLRQLHSY